MYLHTTQLNMHHQLQGLTFKHHTDAPVCEQY